MPTSKPPINLFRGWPSPSLHPTSALSTASTHVLSNPSLSAPALGYGPDEGDPGLRHEIASWLTSFYDPVAGPVSADRICITGGASQNLACMLQVFTDPAVTRRVWMVRPTYYLACRIFDDAGFAGRLRGVPEDDEGLDVDVLEEGLKAAEEEAMGKIETPLKTPRPWRKVYKHIIYATPTLANPSTKIMSLRRREQLVRIARKYDALIVADDVYDHLFWPISPCSGVTQDKALVPRLVDIDRYLDGGPKDEFGNAMSNGSFSKIMGAGCRVGWAEGTPQFAWGVSQVGSSRSGGAPSQLVSTFISHLLKTHFLQSHIANTLLPAYARRHRILFSAAREHLLPLGVTFDDPQQNGVTGGFFLWLRLPSGLKASELARKAKDEENLLISEGSIFGVEGDETLNTGSERDLEGYVRICFAWEEEELLEAGVKRLAAVIGRELKALKR
ncbi:hypothetical protein VTO42DRAFT_2749 [Malbranchea cinnamomea]